MQFLIDVNDKHGKHPMVIPVGDDGFMYDERRLSIINAPTILYQAFRHVVNDCSVWSPEESLDATLATLENALAQYGWRVNSR